MFDCLKKICFWKLWNLKIKVNLNLSKRTENLYWFTSTPRSHFSKLLGTRVLASIQKPSPSFMQIKCIATNGKQICIEASYINFDCFSYRKIICLIKYRRNILRIAIKPRYNNGSYVQQTHHDHLMFIVTLTWLMFQHLCVWSCLLDLLLAFYVVK